MHHPYLVCILFGMPSLHLFTFLMFLFSCVLALGLLTKKSTGSTDILRSEGTGELLEVAQSRGM